MAIEPNPSKGHNNAIRQALRTTGKRPKRKERRLAINAEFVTLEWQKTG